MAIEWRSWSLALRSTLHPLEIEELLIRNGRNEGGFYVNDWVEYSWIVWERGGDFLEIGSVFCLFICLLMVRSGHCHGDCQLNWHW